MQTSNSVDGGVNEFSDSEVGRSQLMEMHLAAIELMGVAKMTPYQNLKNSNLVIERVTNLKK